MEKNTKKELKVIAFKSQNEFEKWMSKNHGISYGIWMRYFRKASKIKTIVYAEALDVALCYGWIDSQADKYDDKSWLQKFTPRRPKSIWSKRNIGHFSRLKKENKIMHAGMKAFEEAKADGRLASAYDSPKNMKVPQDFLKEISKNKKAKEFFKTLNKANIYSIAWRLQTAKKHETRKRRMKSIIEMLSNKKKFH